MPEQPDLAPDPWGIHATWIDAADQVQRVPAETVELLRTMIGTPPSDLDERAPLVVRPGDRLDTGPVEVTLEQGGTRDVEDVLPADFPLGYHWVTTPSGLRRRLIVSPGRCWLPPTGRAWGWSVQLYATRSSDSWGIGDLADLRTIRLWAERQGAGFLLVNPLHAVGPGLPQEPSPYLPATRRFRNPLYLCVEEVPGAELVDLSDLAVEGRALGSAELIDRDRVFRLKDEALRRIHAVRARADDFALWREAQGQPLQRYAAWCAVSREHGPAWQDWPEALWDPQSDAVASYVAEHDDEVTYQAWLQWALDEQLREATGDLTVIQDLPVGVSGGGADAWEWQALLADGSRVGAPPDLFNQSGQDWGSPPLVPWRLREDNYEAFVQTIRATIAGAGGLRIDHVMGLFRLWWVPADGSARDGAYVRYPSDDLLDIVALESHRAQALVVGEDLGTVEDGVREALAERDMLSYRLLWFEDDDPEEWPAASMAAVTTHDLPTVVGLWTGSDVDDQVRHTGLGERDARKGAMELLARLRRDGLAEDAAPREAVLAAHRQVARARSFLLSATLEDAVGEPRRPNLPGSHGRPNWCLPLAVPVDELVEHEGPAALARLLAGGVGPGASGPETRAVASAASVRHAVDGHQHRR